jgi:hypothetical protein
MIERLHRQRHRGLSFVHLTGAPALGRRCR